MYAFRIQRISKEWTKGSSGDAKCRLVADVSVCDGASVLCAERLWYEVDSIYAQYLVTECADCFVAALMYSAVSLGYDIESKVPVSGRILYQLNEYLIPSIAKVSGKQKITVQAEILRETLLCSDAVGTGYSGGVDSMYTVCMHTGQELQAGFRPKLTHLCVINSGVYEGEQAEEEFYRACKNAETFARELGLQFVGINSNIHLVLPERYLDVSSYRLCAAALALQKLFSVYLLSSGLPQETFRLQKNYASLADLLNTQMFSTDALRFIQYGAGVRRVDKISKLVSFEPAYTRLHPCFQTDVTKKNCGHCKKCRRDTVVLWALGALDRFSAVYDVEKAEKERDISIAFLLANRESYLYREALELLQEKGISIPGRSRVLAK